MLASFKRNKCTESSTITKKVGYVFCFRKACVLKSLVKIKSYFLKSICINESIFFLKEVSIKGGGGNCVPFTMDVKKGAI